MGSDDRVGSPVLEKVLSLLDNIKSTEAGSVIYEHVVDMLKEIDTRDCSVELTYAEMLNSLLEAISSHFDEDDVLRVQIKMVQLRLVPPISGSEISTLVKHINQIAAGISDSDIDVEKMRQALADNATPGVIPEALIDPVEIVEIDKNSSDEALAVQGALSGSDNAGSDNESAEQDEQYVAMRSGPRKDKVEVDPRNFPSIQNQELDEIRNSLARHVEEAIAQNQQFGVLLGVELEALRNAETVHDVDVRRSTLVGEIESLIHKHATLSEKFSNASKYLTMIETDNQQLTDELDRVRLLSLTDELTTLPNRRAFMRRLEDEVGRVKRYGYPISLTLIDLDLFKGVNDQYGHAGGDAVLKTYAEEVLTIFRHHDMVARYGGEEFAVILPNTDKEGALSALRKVQEGVAQILCVLNDETISMPTFSAGLAQYIDGETPDQFIERADEALYRAKNQGRNRIELAGDEGAESDASGKKDLSAHHGWN